MILRHNTTRNRFVKRAGGDTPQTDGAAAEHTHRNEGTAKQNTQTETETEN
jgi:hypothetical protein